MKVYVGDITKIDDVDVIVNAADTDFTPGGGIARWIAKAGGNIFGSLAPREVALLSDRLEHGAI